MASFRFVDEGEGGHAVLENVWEGEKAVFASEDRAEFLDGLGVVFDAEDAEVC